MKRSAADLIELALIIIALMFALAVMASLIAAPAHAQPVCGDRANLINVLAGKYKELPKAFGIAGQRNLVELFVSKTGSWTMIVTQPLGPSCILATGQGWEEVPPIAPYEKT